MGELPAAEGVPDQAEWVCPRCGFSAGLEAFVPRSIASAVSSAVRATSARDASSSVREYRHRPSTSEHSVYSTTSTLLAGGSPSPELSNKAPLESLTPQAILSSLPLQKTQD